MAASVVNTAEVLKILLVKNKWLIKMTSWFKKIHNDFNNILVKLLELLVEPCTK